MAAAACLILETEIAEMLEVSPTTIERDWAVARLWLRRQMDGTSP